MSSTTSRAVGRPRSARCTRGARCRRDRVRALVPARRAARAARRHPHPRRAGSRPSTPRCGCPTSGSTRTSRTAASIRSVSAGCSTRRCRPRCGTRSCCSRCRSASCSRSAGITRSSRRSPPCVLLFTTTYHDSFGQLFHTENLMVLYVIVLAIVPAADALVARPATCRAPRHRGAGQPGRSTDGPPSCCRCCVSSRTCSPGGRRSRTADGAGCTATCCATRSRSTTCARR